MNTILRVEFGSHLYGTNTESSDRDYKSLHIPEARDILLQRVEDLTGHKIKRLEGDRNSKEDVDDESYTLQRYLKLLAQGQTVAIDILFAPNPLVTSDLWGHIKFHKDKILNKKCATFVGYMRQQSAKYGIRGSRVSSAKEAVAFFEEAISSKGSSTKVRDIMSDTPGQLDEHTRVLSKETTPGKYETYFECCNRMVGFNNTVLEAHKVYKRIYDKYGNRARLAEQNEGVDWKALSHAVRVGHEALELLATHYVTFPLPNRAHILDIKLGKLPYKQVAEEIEQLLTQVEEAEQKSTLREEPDYEFIDDLVVEEYRERVTVERT